MLTIRPHRNNFIDTYNPFREMEALERAFFGEPFTTGLVSRGGGFKTDIKDVGNSYLLEAELPGFAKNDIKLELNDDVLTVSAERSTENKEENEQDKYIRCERYFGKFTRSFDVSNVETDDIKAKYENGILSVTLPKKKETVVKGRQLEIE